MTYHEQYLEAAIEDLVEIQWHYDAQRAGLGTDFSNAVTQRIEVLLGFPESAAVFSQRGARRVSVERFPYHIIYQLRTDVVLIVAVTHHHRHPRHWLSRLEPLE
jgi:toxin ParE1/3/4